MRLVIAIIFFLGSSLCYSQKEDYNWLIGKYSTNNEATYPVGINSFDFNNDPVEIIENDNIKITFNWTCSLLNSKKGEFNLISNGMHILGKDFKTIIGAEKINFNEYWKIFKDTYADNSERLRGLSLSQGMLMLPWPDRDSVMWLTPNLQANGSIFNSYCRGMFFGILDNSFPKPKVILKDSLITLDSINENGIQACRHANGRDWWIVMSNHSKSKIYTYLFDPSGIKKVKTFSSNLNYIAGLGQTCFSPKGDKFAIFEVIGGFGLLDQGHLSILDFDRCTGEFSNLRYKKIVGEGFLVGCAISQSGQYLYTGNSTTLTQFDLFASNILNSERIVAKSDGFESVYNEQTKQENLFLFMQLAPDGKIYGPGGNTLHMHRMEYPDEKGEACTMTQHAINTVSNACTIPNFPYFRLGPEDGSSCDTLGLDNHPIAKYRYEADTLDHLKVRFTDLSYFRPEHWTWDFGDGTTFDGRKPYWHTFPKNGTYNVCLTVSNENSSNTSCRLVTIGPNEADEVLPLKEIVSIFPNPVETEMLLTISEYIPEHGVVEVYDAMGKEVWKQRVYYGWNNVDLTNLINGTYYYKVKDKGRQLHAGQFIKIAK
jgi:PKD domain/Secretion system C-terminal sorting domain